MAEYNIFFKQSAVKDLDRIPKKDLQRIIRCIRLLKENPRPPGCEKLSARERYRIRQGKYRIVYSIQDDQLIVWVVKISHRRDVYR
jgi:mRNA interferase RelE/StbE